MLTYDQWKTDIGPWPSVGDDLPAVCRQHGHQLHQEEAGGPLVCQECDHTEEPEA